MTEETEAAAAPENVGFADLGLAPALVQALDELGYEEPTPIQSEAIPVLLSGKDLLGLAATGTGKTAAFALPMLQLIEPGADGPQGLVLVPTRELAMQVAQAVHRYGRARNVHVLPIYGGAAMNTQLRALRRGVDVVVATPGRALDHINRGTLRLDNVRVAVLDEADEMLDMGFQEDLEAILAGTPPGRQMALFSATFPRRLQSIVQRSLPDAVRVEVEKESAAPGEVPRVKQVAYIVRRQNKREALARVLDMEAPDAALVFCRTRIEVDEIADSLQSRGYSAEPLHGGLSQQQRDRVMQKLRSGAADLIVATDVAARGLDIGHLSHVINFDAPAAPEMFIHRIGRTGRAGREGVAITLLEPRERRLIRSIERVTGQSLHIENVPTVSDLRRRSVELVQGQVREAALEGNLEPYMAVFESLSAEFDVVEVAAAAIKALHKINWTEQEAKEDIAPVQGGHGLRDDRPGPRRHQDREGGRGPGQSQSRGPSQGRGPGGSPDRGYGGGRGGDAGGDGEWGRIFIGCGRRAHIGPGDIFGAIVNETGLARDAVGAIRITEKFSLVDVPAADTDRVIAALRNTTIRGMTLYVRRDRRPS